MIIKDAETATEIARKFIGHPKTYSEPRSCKKESEYWVVKLNVGAITDIIVTVELPERSAQY